MKLLLAVTTLAASASAHFVLNYPPTIGFSDDDEATGPCGSFTPDFSKDNVTDFHVGGDNIAVNYFHSQGTWLFRGTLDKTASGNWTQLFPFVLQSGLGAFCEPDITVPSSWAGQEGVLSIVVDAPDGTLYQCAAVRFVAGKASSVQKDCTNSSSPQFSFTSDSNLTPLVSGDDDSTAATTTTAKVGTATETTTGKATGTAAATTTTVAAASGSATGSGTAAASASASSTKSAAAPGLVASSFSLGSMAVAAVGALAGAALLW